MTPESSPERAAPSPAVTLRRLFLTLFLRGRTARGLQKSDAPSSVGSKLFWTLGLYALFGCVALVYLDSSVFVLSAMLHAMTFLTLGMFVAASSGEVLFNPAEADILLHRPVAPRSLLWAKAGVLVEVSLWLAGALNLFAFFVGVRQGGWLFPLAHALSITLEAVFATSCVVLVYQLCLRWFGRERLDGLMTAAQVGVAVGITLGGQLVGPLMRRIDGLAALDLSSWWFGLLPPVWFASFDDALAGTGRPQSWALAGVGIAATLAVAGLALGKLAGDYQSGLQALSESPARSQMRAERRWFDVLVNSPPLSWWLRDSVSRAAFLLTAAYLVRDRDTKLRLYPPLASTLALPVIFLVRSERDGIGSFGLAFAGGILGMLPGTALGMLKYSQHWQATDIFRAIPLPGPAPFLRGARWAVLVVLTLPAILLLGAIAWLVGASSADVSLILPGVIMLPVSLLVPCLDGGAVPFSRPAEDARGAGNSARIIAAMMLSMAISLLGVWARTGGWLWWLVLVEALAVGALCIYLRSGLAAVRWATLE